MHVTILAHGSRGDVQPYIALGTGLQRAGHRVRLAAPELYRSFVKEYGFEFSPLAGDPPELVRSLVEAGWNPLRVARAIGDYALPLAAQLMADVESACADTEMIVHTLLTTSIGHEVALAMGIPDVSALVFPVFSPTGSFAGPMFPALPLGKGYNRLTHQLFVTSAWVGMRFAYHLMRRNNPHLPPLSGWPFDAPDGLAPPILYGFSRHVISPPQDWGPDSHITGYWFLDGLESWQPPEELSEFLEAGPPPVYIGFGSMVTDAAADLTRVAIETLARTGQRGILLTGWAGIGAQDLGKDVLLLEYAPFEWLFPRVAAVVCHSGIGTTAAALRAGVPIVAVPFTSDQPFWGRTMHRAGVGPAPIPRKKLTVKRLAAAIEYALDKEGVRRRAVELGGLIRSEDGVACAVDLMERHYFDRAGTI